MTTITIDRAVVEQAIKAMLNFPGDISDEMFDSIRALRAALAQQAEPVQEPFGYLWPTGMHPEFRFTQQKRDGVDGMPLYTTPPQRKPLTEEEIDVTTAQERDALLDHIYEYGTAAEGVLERIRKLCRAVERAHGIKE